MTAPDSFAETPKSPCREGAVHTRDTLWRGAAEWIEASE